MSGGLRVLLVVVGATAAIVLFVVFRGGDDDEPSVTQPTTSAVSTIRTIRPPPPKPFLVAISTDALKRATIPRGREVLLVISGLATGEEVHLHGYDVKRRSGPSGVVRIEFRATIPGRFEVELEESHRQLADLTVR